MRKPVNTALVVRDGYKTYLSDTLQEKYLRARRSFDDFNLSEELTVLRMVMGKVLEGLEKSEEFRVEDVTKVVREIRETLKLMAEWMEKSMVPVATLHVFQQQIVLILQEELKDNDKLQRIASRLGQVSLPRDRNESDRLDAAIRSGEVPSPSAG